MAARQKSFRGDHASDEVFDFECGPCQFDGKTLEANGFCSDCSEYLCDLCFKTHLKPMPCRHHILLDASKMPKDKSAVKTVDVSTVRCEKHAANVIEYYCSIHEYLGCSTCMTLEHRACEGVSFIPSIAEGLYETQEYVDYKQSINDVVKSTKDNELKINRNTTDAERLYNTTKNEIKEYRKKINLIIDSLEDKIDTDLSNLYANRITLLKEATDSNKSLDKEIKDVSAEVTKGETQVKQIDYFILMKHKKGNIQEYTKKADAIRDKSNVSKYSFRNEFEKCKPLLDGLFGRIVEEVKLKPKQYDVPTYGSELAKAMYIGARVQRGKDWQCYFGVQDDGPGTLTGWGKHPGWVRVTWDNGKKSQYRYGADNAYDVMFVPGTYDASKSNRK